MTSKRPWVLYTVLRLGIFAIVLTALLLLGLEPWFAALAAAAVGLCVTYIFFSRQREQVVTSFYEYRTAGSRDADAEVEDELVASDDTEASKVGSEGEGRGEPDAEEERGQAR